MGNTIRHGGATSFQFCQTAIEFLQLSVSQLPKIIFVGVRIGGKSNNNKIFEELFLLNL